MPEAAAAESVPQIEQISQAQTQVSECKVSAEQDQLHKQGQVFAVQTQDENQQAVGKIEFELLPKNLRDSVVGKEV